MSSEEPVLIVDGHSAIFAWRDLRQMHQQSTLMARRELIARLTHYQDATGVHVVLVFDGKGAKTDKEGGERGDILVLYSRRGETADSVIERMVARLSGAMKITVASNDRAELEAVTAFGGDCIGLKTLREMLEGQAQQSRERWGY